MAYLLKLSRPKNNVLLTALLACIIIMMMSRSGNDDREYNHAEEIPMENTEIKVPRRELQKIVQNSLETQHIETQVIEIKPRFNIARKIAYISRHVGTTADFKYMADSLQLENVDFFHPEKHKWYGYHEHRDVYLSIIDNGVREKMCSEYDAIFISDSLSDGWGYLVGNKPMCKNVYFVVTNRFDYGVRWNERGLFHKDFNEALNREENPIHLIVNNPFEIPYIKDKGVSIPDEGNIPLIRPFGHTTFKENDEHVDPEMCVIISRTEQEKVFLREQMKEKVGIECKLIDHNYGGPRALSKYQSIVVHIPYQVSIMKMWENIAYGTLMAIPTPRFFSEMCVNGADCREARDAFETKKVVGDEKWADYIDFYQKGWEDCFIQFDSWEELKTLLETRSYQKSINYCRNKVLDLREDNLKAWKKVLESLK